MRRGLLASTAVGFVRRMAPAGTPVPDNILKYLRPGQRCEMFISRVGDTEITVVNNVVVTINGTDVGGYGLRYSVYAKMNEHEKEWARFSARCYALRERESLTLQKIRTGIVMPLFQKHLNPGIPWFPYNPMGAGA